MPLKIYNSLSKKKEEFLPLETGKVKMYVCGVTVYDRCHIGHARAAVVFDVIYRFLRSLDYQVNYVQNYTDVDDKIINKANKEGVSSQAIAERYIQEHLQDMQALGWERPTHQPRATENIPQIIDLVRKLVEKVSSHPKIHVHLSTALASISGSVAVRFGVESGTDKNPILPAQADDLRKFLVRKGFIR